MTRLAPCICGQPAVLIEDGVPQCEHAAHFNDLDLPPDYFTTALCAECGAEIPSHDCDLHLIESDPQTDAERHEELQDLADELAMDAAREADHAL